jgi:DNA-binding transcriptional MerR regulator
MSFSFSDWYKLHGARLNEKRKQRYHSDPEYRKKVLETNQQSRRQRKQADDAPTKRPRVKKESERFKTVKVLINGIEVDLYTVGALAEALGCSIQAIRLWERQGIIPPSTVRSGKGENGDRLYSKDEIEEIRKVLDAQGRLRRDGDKPSVETRPLIRFVRYPDGSIKKVKLLLIGALAKAVQRNVVTLEQLEAKGFLPKTPLRASSVGRRLYTARMIAAVKSAFDARGGEIRGEAAWKEFHDDVLARWTAQGVMGAVLVEAAPPNQKEVTVNDSEHEARTTH